MNIFVFLQSNTTSSTIAKTHEAAKTTYQLATDSLESIWNSLVERLPYFLAGLVIMAIFWLFSVVLKRLFWTTAGQTKLDERLRILFRRLIGFVVFTVGFLTALTVILPGFGFGDLMTGLGFSSFAIGFATKDILNNALSGILILWQQPFKLGDYIFFKSIEGKVNKIGVRATSLIKDDGELVMIPNGDLYSNLLTIRGAGAKRRKNLKICVDFSANIAKTKKVIFDTLNNIDGIEKTPPPRVVVTDLNEQGVNLSIYVWIDTDNNSPMDILDSFASALNDVFFDKNIALYPPSTVIVENQKRQKQDDAEGDDQEEKKGDFR